MEREGGSREKYKKSVSRAECAEEVPQKVRGRADGARKGSDEDVLEYSISLGEML